MAGGNQRSSVYIDSNFFDANGYTGTTYYYRLVQRGSGYVWDNTNEELAENPDWGDSAIAMEAVGTTGQYKVIIPVEVESSTYDLIIYLQAGATPANTDDVQNHRQIKIGSIYGF